MKEEDEALTLRTFLNLRMNLRKYNSRKYNSRKYNLKRFLRIYLRNSEKELRKITRKQIFKSTRKEVEGWCEKDMVGTTRP